MSPFPASKRAAKFLSAKISVGIQTFGLLVDLSTKDRIGYCKSVRQAMSVISGSCNNFSCVETHVFILRKRGKMNEFCHFLYC